MYSVLHFITHNKHKVYHKISSLLLLLALNDLFRRSHESFALRWYVPYRYIIVPRHRSSLSTRSVGARDFSILFGQGNERSNGIIDLTAWQAQRTKFSTSRQRKIYYYGPGKVLRTDAPNHCATSFS